MTTLTKETITEIAIAANLNFLLLDKLMGASEEVLVLSLSKLGSASQEEKDSLGKIAKNLVVMKCLISTVMDYLEDKLETYRKDNPGSSKEIRDDLTELPVIHAMERELHMTGAQRVAKLFAEAGVDIPDGL